MANSALIEKKSDQNGGSYSEGFLREPVKEQNDSKSFNKMCCCRSNLPHDSVEKFILLGTKKGKNQTIKVCQQKLQGVKLNIKHEWKLNLQKKKHWLWGRNLDLHRIIEFIFSVKLYCLVIEGPKRIGVSTIIKKAVQYSMKRHSNFQWDAVFLVKMKEKVEKEVKTVYMEKVKTILDAIK